MSTKLISPLAATLVIMGWLLGSGSVLPAAQPALRPGLADPVALTGDESSSVTIRLVQLGDPRRDRGYVIPLQPGRPGYRGPDVESYDNEDLSQRDPRYQRYHHPYSGHRSYYYDPNYGAWFYYYW